jgi:glycosyltransferase involved in cell wall biosynthesis
MEEPPLGATCTRFSQMRQSEQPDHPIRSMPQHEPLVSIIIDNYNYAAFLEDAVQSALNQTYSPTEVIVVDDGSTDASREILARFGDRITTVLKENGGQASAFNAGFAASRGEIVVILDSDDMLLPDALEAAVPLFDGPDVVKVHWPLQLVDECGRSKGRVHPNEPLPDGDFRSHVLECGPVSLPGSGLGAAWARSYLEKIFPVPESTYRIAADTYLFELAPFFGRMRALGEPKMLYREHGTNDHVRATIDLKVERGITFYEHYCGLLVRHLERQNLHADLDRWKRHSWWHRLDACRRDIRDLPVPPGEVVLIDEGTFEGGPLGGRSCLPFPGVQGCFEGRPSRDQEAIDELERLRKGGAVAVVFAWPAYWWLDYYTEFAEYLDRRYPCLLRNDRLVAYGLF